MWANFFDYKSKKPRFPFQVLTSPASYRGGYIPGFPVQSLLLTSREAAA
jgi:hypothetical protein